MFLFGHLGITAGVVKLGYTLATRSWGHESLAPEASRQSGIATGSKSNQGHLVSSAMVSHFGSIDYRAVLLGAMLPDILDKPSWLLGFGAIFASGHGYAHTLLFNLVCLVSGLILLKYKKSFMLLISLSSFVHLILDRILWENPVVLWWPMLGTIQRVEPSGWWSSILNALLRDPRAYIPEILGLTVVLLLGYRLVVKRGITSFIRTGVIP